MRQILYILGLAVSLSLIYSSCKTNTLDSLHEDEVVARDKYIKDNNLTDALDVSGIYFKDIIKGTPGDSIKKGYKAMLFFNITLLDGTVVFTTDDGLGHDYEQYAFYVDVSNTVVNAQYVQQIAGLHSGLKKMLVGGKAFMVIPSEYAFKAVDNSSLGIPRFSTLLATVTVKKAYSPAEQQ
jgi:hypothetical protein